MAREKSQKKSVTVTALVVAEANIEYAAVQLISNEIYTDYSK